MAIEYKYKGLYPVEFISIVEAKRISHGDTVSIDDSEDWQFCKNTNWEKVDTKKKTTEKIQENKNSVEEIKENDN